MEKLYLLTILLAFASFVMLLIATVALTQVNNKLSGIKQLLKMIYDNASEKH